MGGDVWVGPKKALDYIRDHWLVGWLQKLPDWGQGWAVVLLSVTWEAWYLARQSLLKRGGLPGEAVQTSP